MLNIKTDSRKVEKGDTFVAIKGYTVDGHDYINEAIKNGASLVVCEHGEYSVDTLIVDNTEEYLREVLSKNYSKDFCDLKLIGVTGTSGKTTTCYLLYNALLKLDKKCAYIGTIGFYINGEKIMDLPNTTPDVLMMYNLLSMCAFNCVEYVICEVSSHALELDRLHGINFDVGLFTNLSRDHLDFHETFENYANAKRKLFEKLKNDKIAIINIDSDYNDYMFLDGNKNVTFGFGKSDIQILNFENNSDGVTFEFKYNDKVYFVKSSLCGKYNVYNVMSVVAILVQIGFDIYMVIDAISTLESPRGRMEKINYKTNIIVIDYAHKPDAVEKVIKTAREFTKNRVITLIGCGGDRDKTKRPIMANIASSLSDYTILTSDNPRSESIDGILDEMEEGCVGSNYTRIVDRGEAIRFGIDMLKSDDAFLILGKGHEDYQIIGREKIYFNDMEEAREYIKIKE